MSTGTSKTPAQWGDEYGRCRQTFDDFRLRLETLLKDLLRDAGLDVVQIESRAKTVESFVDKIGRKKGRYESPLDDITDLAGVRVIAYYVEDVSAVGELLRREFDVDEANTIDHEERHGPSEFGYPGDNFVVRLAESRSSLPEWAPFRELCVEIQVRTATQHAWAAVEHKLSYKAGFEVPDTLRRRFYRLSALFELADDQFSVLRREHRALEASYADSLREGDLEIEIDSASLDAYLSETPRLTWLRSEAEDIGWDVVDVSEQRARRDRADLEKALRLAGVSSIAELDRLLRDEAGASDALRALRDALTESSAKMEDPWDLASSIDDVLTQLILWKQDVSVEDVATIYSSGYAEVFGSKTDGV